MSCDGNKGGSSSTMTAGGSLSLATEKPNEIEKPGGVPSSATVGGSRSPVTHNLDGADAVPPNLDREDAVPPTKRPLPEGWRWIRLGEVGNFDSGGTPPKENAEFWGGNIPFITGADVTDLYVSSKNARAFLTEAGLASGKTAVCHPGTVLFVTRTRVGRVGIAAEMMGASQDLSPYKCGPQLCPEYVCRYLLSIADYLLENCRGATIQGLTRDFVNRIEIPLPPLAEQKRIAAMLREQMAAVERARRALGEQLEAINKLPAAILRKAFNGEL